MGRGRPLPSSGTPSYYGVSRILKIWKRRFGAGVEYNSRLRIGSAVTNTMLAWLEKERRCSPGGARAHGQKVKLSIGTRFVKLEIEGGAE